MHPPRRHLAPWTLPGILVALAALVHPAAAQLRGPEPQSRTQFGVGFVANAPDAVLGVSAYVLLPAAGGVGLYVDAKFDNANPSSELGYDARYTARQVAGEHEERAVFGAQGAVENLDQLCSVIAHRQPPDIRLKVLYPQTERFPVGAMCRDGPTSRHAGR